MDSASLQIKFIPVIKFLDDVPHCLIEITPEVSEICGFNDIEWKHNGGQIEYNIPMKYKVVLKKMEDSQSTQHAFATQYYSCVDVKSNPFVNDNKVSPKENFVNLTDNTMESNDIKLNDINKSSPNTNLTHSKHSLKFIKQSIYYSKVSETSCHASKVSSQISCMMAQKGSVTSFEDCIEENGGESNDELPTIKKVENTAEITVCVGAKMTENKQKTMRIKKDHEVKVFNSSFINLNKDFDDQSAIIPPSPIFDHRINYIHDRPRSKTNITTLMDYCRPKRYLNLPFHDTLTQYLRQNANLRYTDWEELKLNLNFNNTAIGNPVDSKVIRTEAYKKRELPQDRISRIIKYCENQFLPINELLNDINKKCSELKLSHTWAKKFTNSESPIYMNRGKCHTKPSFKNCKSDLKEISKKDVIQFNRVMYTIKVDS